MSRLADAGSSRESGVWRFAAPIPFDAGGFVEFTRWRRPARYRGRMTKRTVSAVFDDHGQANRAVEGLTSAGYDRDDVSVVMADDTKEKLFPGESKKVEEGTGIGAGIGALAGTFGALASLPVPGGLFAAGPIGAAMTAAATGAAGGGLVGALGGLGVPRDLALRYEAKLKSGGVGVAVETGTIDETREAESVLLSAGGDSARDTLVTTKPQP